MQNADRIAFFRRSGNNSHRHTGLPQQPPAAARTSCSGFHEKRGVPKVLRRTCPIKEANNTEGGTEVLFRPPADIISRKEKQELSAPAPGMKPTLKRSKTFYPPFHTCRLFNKNHGIVRSSCIGGIRN